MAKKKTVKASPDPVEQAFIADLDTPLFTSSTYRKRERSLGSLTQLIVQDLGTAIVTGEYATADAFPIEAEICKKYDASRSIVREALKVLNAKGLLIARPRRGTRIRPERDWNLLDPDVLYWMLKRRFSLSLMVEFTYTRLGIEPAAAAQAAKTATPEQKHDNVTALRHMEEATEGAFDPLEADISFHLSLLQASNNRFFYHLSPMVETALRFSIRYVNLKLHRDYALVGDHRAIVDAVLAGDAEAAAEASRVQLQAALDTMVAS
jgi:DNA-binding FadR family transcriptional regulator